MISFFFSSRRRHTRSYGDWSSDVCSSDLRRTAGLPGSRPGSRKPCSSTPPADPPISTIRWVGVGLATPPVALRSYRRNLTKNHTFFLDRTFTVTLTCPFKWYEVG